MLYWRTFLAMCISVFVLTAAALAIIGLGIFGVFHLSVGLWVAVGIGLAVMMMSSVICLWMLEAEFKERRIERDNRKNA